MAVWPRDKAGYVYNNNLLRLRFVSQVDPMFAGWLMISPFFRAYLQTVKSATTSICAIYQRSLMAAPFFFPPLPEQRKVVRRIQRALDWIDRLATEASASRKLIDGLDQAVLRKAFSGELLAQDPSDEPASALLERIRAKRRSPAMEAVKAGPGKQKRAVSAR